jgi:hypothetical protein
MSTEQGKFPFFQVLGAVIVVSIVWKIQDVVTIPLPIMAATVGAGLAIGFLIAVVFGWPTIQVRNGILIERRALFRTARMHVFDIRRVEDHEDADGHPQLIVVSNDGDEIAIDRTFTQVEVDFALRQVRASRPDLVFPDLRVF